MLLVMIDCKNNQREESFQTHLRMELLNSVCDGLEKVLKQAIYRKVIRLAPRLYKSEFI
jgi:hypothetical protein